MVAQNCLTEIGSAWKIDEIKISATRNVTLTLSCVEWRCSYYSLTQNCLIEISPLWKTDKVCALARHNGAVIHLICCMPLALYIVPEIGSVWEIVYTLAKHNDAVIRLLCCVPLSLCVDPKLPYSEFGPTRNTDKVYTSARHNAAVSYTVCQYRRILHEDK